MGDSVLAMAGFSGRLLSSLGLAVLLASAIVLLLHVTDEDSSVVLEESPAKSTDAKEVTKSMLKSMKIRSEKWKQKADDADNGKRFTAAEIKDSEDTSKAAENAYDAERGAKAFSGLAIRAENKGKTQA